MRYSLTFVQFTREPVLRSPMLDADVLDQTQKIKCVTDFVIMEDLLQLVMHTSHATASSDFKETAVIRVSGSLEHEGREGAGSSKGSVGALR